jgi:hypothetical protein
MKWLGGIHDILLTRYPKTQETYVEAFSRTLIGDQDVCTSSTDYRASIDVRYVIATLHRDPRFQKDFTSAFLEDWEGKPSKRLNVYLHMARKLCAERQFFLADKGCIGLAPGEAQVGDDICVLFAGEVPCIVRQKEGHHEFIGEYYCHGFMDGEAVIDEPNSAVTYTLR